MLKDAPVTVSEMPALQMDLTSFLKAEQHNQISIDERRKMAEDIDKTIRNYFKERAKLDKANEGLR